MMNNFSVKEILFSVTAKDCKFDFYSGRGAGGQARNKSLSAVRCMHIASGAVGQSEDERSQTQNKKIAFVRMANSPKFKTWHKIETARQMGKFIGLDEEVDRLMKDRYLRVEMKKDGKWVKEEELEDDGRID